MPSAQGSRLLTSAFETSATPELFASIKLIFQAVRRGHQCYVAVSRQHNGRIKVAERRIAAALRAHREESEKFGIDVVTDDSDILAFLSGLEACVAGLLPSTAKATAINREM